MTQHGRRSNLAAGFVLALAAVCALAAPPPARDGSATVTGVRFWSQGGATRIAIEASGEVKYRWDRLENPPRLFVDLLGSRLKAGDAKPYSIAVGDAVVERIRVAQNGPAVTRVVLDLKGAVEVEVSQLAKPARVMLDVRAKGARPVETAAKPSRTGAERLEEAAPAKPAPEQPAEAAAAKPKPLPAKPAETAAARPAVPAPKPARKTTAGESSLTRVLGLKLAKVVIDPGHGGHDVGTTGPGGLQEKDLVLDLAKRLAELIETKLGSEVILTRTTDVFIPLEERTAIANRHHADLFLSLHANSSPLKSAFGSEVYYLNFTSSKADLEVAARENAGTEKSIFELRELLQKIALKDKSAESRDLAAKLQSALWSGWARPAGASRNRGVKKAPFVVLIGAAMPSALAEVGFLSNSREESTLKKPEQRQRLADTLLRGISSYAGSLSRFEGPRPGGN